MTRNVITRPLKAEDEPLLAHATLGNLNWSEERFTERDLNSRSEFGHYTQLVFERGDFGFVAECADEVVGVAWALFLPGMTRATVSWTRPRPRRARGCGTTRAAEVWARSCCGDSSRKR
jgi:hypothetical protein